MEALVGLGQLGEFAGGFPVERAGVHQQAADGDAVAAEELGGGVVEQVCTQLERPHEVRCSEGRIQQQRHLGVMGDLRDHRHVQHVEPGIAERFAEQQAGVGADRAAPGLQVARIDEGGFDAEALEGVLQQIVRAAVQRAAGDDVGTRRSDGGHCQVQRGLAARRGDRTDAALQCGDALFEDRVGRVGDARVDVPRALHVEQRGSMVGISKYEGGGLVDRRRACTRGGVRLLAGVQAQRVEAQIAGGGHGLSPNGCSCWCWSLAGRRAGTGGEGWFSPQPSSRFQLVASTSKPMAAIQLPATRTAMVIQPTFRRST